VTFTLGATPISASNSTGWYVSPAAWTCGPCSRMLRTLKTPSIAPACTTAGLGNTKRPLEHGCQPLSDRSTQPAFCRFIVIVRTAPTPFG